MSESEKKAFRDLSDDIARLCRTARDAGLKAGFTVGSDWRAGIQYARLDITLDERKPTIEDTARLIGWTWPIPDRAELAA